MFKVLIALTLFASISALVSFSYTNCGNGNEAVKINSFRLPSPIYYGGKVIPTVTNNGSIDGSARRDVRGKTDTRITLVRTVAGLTLPVRCTVVNGLSLGTCNYTDGCAEVLKLNAAFDIFNDTYCPFANTPQGYFWDCKTCPFNLKVNGITLTDDISIDLPDLSLYSSVIKGDLNIGIDIYDDLGQVFCLKDLKFTVDQLPGSSGK